MTFDLSENNELAIPSKDLPELVTFNDKASTVLINFDKHSPATISPRTPIDVALHQMKCRQEPLLFVVDDNNKVMGIISREELIGEEPIRLMQEKRLSRTELTVDLLMSSHKRLLAVDATSTRNALVGHLLRTFKESGAHYIVVVKKERADKQRIVGLFSASQLCKQLHCDINYIFEKDPETIIELQKGRRSLF